MSNTQKQMNEAPKLTSKKYEDMTLPELLETRDKLIEFKDQIKKEHNGTQMLKFALGRVQQLIHYRRTHRKSGLVIPYNKDIMND